jgi:signal transduction histidine kinase
MVAVAWVAVYAALIAASGQLGIGRQMVGDEIYLVGVAAATLMTVMAAQRAEPRWRAMWWVLAASNLLWFVGEVVWEAYDVTGRGVPFPSAADVFYLGSYALAVAAVVVGSRSFPLGAVGRWALDASIVIVTVGFSAYDLLIEPQLSGGDISLAIIVSIAYPLLGVVILMAVTSLAARSDGRLPLPLALVAGAFLVGAATDAVNTYVGVVHGYLGGRWLDIGWQAEVAVLCLAAWTLLRGDTRTVRVIWRWQDVNLPFILTGVVVAQILLAYSVLERRDDLDSLVAAVYAAAALVARLLWVGRDLRGALWERDELEAERRALHARMLRAESDERARIAADLHDDTVQVLVATLMSLDRVLTRETPAETGGQAVKTARDTLSLAVDRTRLLMFELRPPVLEMSGLRAALTQLADRAASECRWTATVDVVAGRFSAATETLVYRTVSEALANVRKHADARNVTVTVTADADGLHGRVADDGVGFDAAHVAHRSDGVSHFGLGMLHERIRLAGGTCHVTSSPGCGCTLEFTLPVDL